jgi:hypothetical protein
MVSRLLAQRLGRLSHMLAVGHTSTADGHTSAADGRSHTSLTGCRMVLRALTGDWQDVFEADHCQAAYKRLLRLLTNDCL